MSIKIDKKKFNKVVPKGYTYSVSQDGSGDYDGTDDAVIQKAVDELPAPSEAEKVVL